MPPKQKMSGKAQKQKVRWQLPLISELVSEWERVFGVCGSWVGFKSTRRWE